jgi:hypothetical protein
MCMCMCGSLGCQLEPRVLLKVCSYVSSMHSRLSGPVHDKPQHWQCCRRVKSFCSFQACLCYFFGLLLTLLSSLCEAAACGCLSCGFHCIDVGRSDSDGTCALKPIPWESSCVLHCWHHQQPVSCGCCCICCNAATPYNWQGVQSPGVCSVCLSWPGGSVERPR